MSNQLQNDPELDNLLLILAEFPDEKINLLPKIMAYFPWGYLPSSYIETIPDPGKRILIRDTIIELLKDEKQNYDLEILLKNVENKDFNEKGAFLFTFFAEDINYTYDDFVDRLDKLAYPLIEKIGLMENSSEKSKINYFREYFFKELKFNSNQDPFKIDNYLIHKVIENRIGGAIILCILANSIAKRAGILLPIVITAGHFLLRTTIENEIPFIDPLQNGRIITEHEHMANVAEKGYDPSIALLHIYSPLTLMQNLARNVMQAIQMTGNKKLYAKVKDFRGILKK